LLKECERLHSTEEEADLLREECVATEDIFTEVSVIAK
jgi:hypothetical protein